MPLRPFPKSSTLPSRSASVVWVYILGLVALFAPTKSPAANFIVAPRLAAAHDDAQAGLLLGLEIPAAGFFWSVFGEFEMRVFGKDRLIPVSPTLRMQYQEVRQTLGMGGQIGIPLNRSALSGGEWGEIRLGGGAGFTFGDFRGTQVRPESRWVPWMDVGYGFRFQKGGMWVVGYQFRPLPHASPHRITLTGYGLLPLGAR